MISNKAYCFSKYILNSLIGKYKRLDKLAKTNTIPYQHKYNNMPFKCYGELSFEDVMVLYVKYRDYSFNLSEHIKNSRFVFQPRIADLYDGRCKVFNTFVNLRGKKLRVFLTHGGKCVKCGLQGNVFMAESCLDGSTKREKPHLNLYHRNKNGGLQMITIDHIIPTSKNGTDSFDNLQPLCYSCNHVKSDKLEGEG